MNVEFNIFQEFGELCAHGEVAAKFRFLRVDPIVSVAEKITFHFDGVRQMNSSFANALISPIVSQHSPSVIRRLRFTGCTPTIQLLIEAALQLGLRNAEASVAA